MSILMSTYNNQGRFSEAVELGKMALDGQRRVLGHDHPHTLWTKNKLTAVYERSGLWAAAIDLRKGVY